MDAIGARCLTILQNRTRSRDFTSEDGCPRAARYKRLVCTTIWRRACAMWEKLPQRLQRYGGSEPWSFELFDWEVKEPLARAFASVRFVVRRGVFQGPSSRREIGTTYGSRIWRRARNPEARASGQDTRRVERIHQEVPRGNDHSGQQPRHRAACRVVSSGQLFGRLLLRERSALPSFGAACACSRRKAPTLNSSAHGTAWRLMVDRNLAPADATVFQSSARGIFADEA